MRVGLNATCYNERPSGAKQRFVGIFSELMRQMPETEFVVFDPADCKVSDWFANFPNVSGRTTSIPSEDRFRKHIKGQFYWRSLLKNERLDFFERFNLPIAKISNGQNLMTIHDIRGVCSQTKSLKQSMKRFYVGRSLKAADQVITVSESMRKEILSVYPNVPISVIYNGIDEAGFDEITNADLAVFRHAKALPENFVLAVGHFEKRKNYSRLIEAIALLHNRGIDCPLLIIGNDSGERKFIDSRIDELDLRGSVTILSGLTDHEVRCAYKLSSLLVFPSFYEGFGIPVLEAMAAKRPMVLSGLPVFREITQDKGLYFPPDDVEAMAGAIETAQSSDSERKRLTEYGNMRIKDFGFSHLASQLKEIYIGQG
jgi:glycosyltransferase involved in cell wall biosynthesis